MRLSMVFILLIFAASAAQALPLPSFTELRSAHRSSEGVILDRHGEVIHELRLDQKGRRLQWTPLRDVSPQLVRAVLQSEDRNFYRHSGADWRAVGAAALGRLFGSRKRGGSTITMQLAVMTETGLTPKGRKNFGQKWDQIRSAIDLEKRWKKDEILEAYLNLVSFRGELQGIAAAARGLFGKEPSGLDDRESCLLAALIRSPNASAADVATRTISLARSLRQEVNDEELRRFAADSLSHPYRLQPRIALAPHLARRLTSGAVSGRKGADSAGRFRSTLDLRLQRFVLETMRQHLEALRAQNVGEGAVLVVENDTGNVLAYVGSAADSQVDGVIARRQAGSTLKPFLYGLAFEKKILTASSILDDSPLHIPTGRGLYVPHDYDHRSRGPVTVRTALSSSLNVPAVRTQLLVGTEPFAERLRSAGFGLKHSGEYYGFSLALGTADVSLQELTNAYRTLARGGLRSELAMIPAPPARSRRVMDRRAAYLVADILSDRSSRSMTFGFDNPLATRFWSAVKTGTSKDMRDNWCVGFSRRYTVGVWVGNFRGDPMWNVSGVSGAAPVWVEVMNYLHRDGGSLPPSRPEGVVEVISSYQNGNDGQRTELFLSGTEPAPESADAGRREKWRIPTIAYPPPGTVIVIDPDIPERNQLVFFEARDGRNDLTWRLNGAALPPGESGRRWKPRPGSYRLSLIDKSGETVGSSWFEVRGNSP